MTTYPLTYAWGNNAKRATLKGRSCRVVARGRKNSVLVEFENGQREITSRYAVRPKRVARRRLDLVQATQAT